ncbi:MAG: GNAT family N-acetyltransferase [Rhizobiaceae bacterium]|nr:GNAT family N-acetyltransferase [Rhizobiaceae bacterium]
MPSLPDELSFAAVTSENWADFEALFEGPGGPKHCWCMVWRRSSEEAKNQDPSFRKSLIAARIAKKEPIGILAYADGKAVAWCSVAPRAAHRPTMAKIRKGDAGGAVWSLACFFVRRPFRGRGLMRRLIVEAGRYAKREGATVLEAYPVERDAPSYRFGGFTDVFDEAGFTRVDEAGLRRKVYRLAL